MNFCSKFVVNTLPATVANADIGSLKSLHRALHTSIIKYQFFTKIALANFTYSQNRYFIIGRIETKCSNPKTFRAGTCKESTFSFLEVVSL